VGSPCLGPISFRRPPCNRGSSEEHEGGEDEWCAGKFERWAGNGIRPDEGGKCLREEGRPDQAGHAVDAGDGALQLALFRTVDASGHERLVRGTDQAPEGHHGNPETKNPAFRRKAVDDELRGGLPLFLLTSR